MGGLGLALGALTIPSALRLIGLCIAALAVDGLKRIPAMHPLDRADRAGDLLYLPEVLYVVCLLAVLSFGPGAYSLDKLVWGQPDPNEARSQCTTNGTVLRWRPPPGDCGRDRFRLTL